MKASVVPPPLRLPPLLALLLLLTPVLKLLPLLLTQPWLHVCGKALMTVLCTIRVRLLPVLSLLAS
jgi:hypothetical protein